MWGTAHTKCNDCVLIRNSTKSVLTNAQSLLRAQSWNPLLSAFPHTNLQVTSTWNGTAESSTGLHNQGSIPSNGRDVSLPQSDRIWSQHNLGLSFCRVYAGNSPPAQDNACRLVFNPTHALRAWCLSRRVTSGSLPPSSCTKTQCFKPFRVSELIPLEAVMCDHFAELVFLHCICTLSPF